MLAMALAACGDGAGEAPVPGAVRDAAVVRQEPKRPLEDPWAQRYYEGYLAETVRGDVAAARAAFEEVVAGAGQESPRAAARAALRLAELEALAGRRRKAVELLARASVLGRDDPAIVEQADRLQVQLASVRAQASEVRGPPLGAELPEVAGKAHALFAAAETELGEYYAIALQPRLEALRASVRSKERATEQAVRAYREVVATGEPTAVVAAEFRAGSVYHDLAIALMFDLPPELEPQAAAKMRRSLRARALGYLRKAEAAYGRSLEAVEGLEGQGGIERWRAPAELGLRSVRDLLSGDN
jgi:hypothetical protein